jgi:hypothetical protein
MKLAYSTICLLFLFGLSSQIISAQPKKGKFIKASVGLAQSYPYNNIDIYGTGFYAQGEYVIGLKTWFGLRPYAGVLFTSSEDNQVPNYAGIVDVTTNAFLLGIKARIAAPIPYVAPYIESGFGASIGSFTNITPSNNFDKNGIIAHIPLTLGLAIGKKHSLEIEFSYYFHNSVEQINGAFAVGYTFPLQ